MGEKQRDPKQVAPDKAKSSGKGSGDANTNNQLERPSVQPEDDFGGEKTDKHKSGQNQKR